MKNQETKTLVTNRKARFNYEIKEKIEAGLVLHGTEIKSLRQGRASLVDAFAFEKDGEIFIYDMNIPVYDQGNINNHNPKRPRKCLLHKQEIKRLTSKIRERGLSLIPLSIYLKKGIAKVCLGLGKGRKTYDKKQHIKNRDIERETRRILKECTR